MAKILNFLRTFPWRKHALLIAGVCLLLFSFGAAWYMIANRPVSGRVRGAALIPQVNIVVLEPKDVSVEINAMGLVTPSMRTDIRSRVVGEIVELHEHLEPGGILLKDETIVKIDDSDYKLVVDTMQANLAKAEAALQIERAQQKIAEAQFSSYQNRETSERLDMDMILRKPHERSVIADVQTAKANLEKAQLNLDRTKIAAPFNSVVIEKDVDIGEQADTQRILAVIACVDSFWVRLLVPVESLRWVEFPTRESPEGSKVFFETHSGVREGRVLKLFANLSEKGRMAQILAEVKDPLCLKPENQKLSPLLIGKYINASISGKQINGVLEIPRTAFRDSRSVWLMDADDRLQIVDVTPVWTTRDHIYVNSSDLPGKSRLVVSDLGFPVKNMSLALAGSHDATGKAQGKHSGDSKK
ncbi:MAG: efflux RND transporter periplasmic adaptor subunit [Victivallales bacterium]|nr:efflux RND transporter periplasmic adaptor subunit [Victivallales bacterium]